MSTIIPSRFISYTTSLPNSRQAFLGVGHRGVVDVARTVGPARRIRPGQRHVAHAQRIVLPQQGQRVLDRVPALDAHQRGQLVLPVRELDPCRRGHKHHLVRVLGRLLLYRVDQHQRALGILSLVELGLNPDGEEFRAQVSLARRLQVEIAAIERAAEIVVLIDKALRRVGVRIDHEGGAVHGFRGQFCTHRPGRLGLGNLG